MSFYSKSTGGFYTQEKHGSEMPDDVVEITTAEHIAVLDAEASGQVIVPGQDGKPIAIDPPPPTSEQLAGIARRKRDVRLSACDWTQARDVPDALSAKWQPYRQALRDISKQAGFPAVIDWPEAP